MRRATIDVYLSKSLRGFKQDIITTATTPVVATQLPLIRNPLAPVRIKKEGRRRGHRNKGITKKKRKKKSFTVTVMK